MANSQDTSCVTHAAPCDHGLHLNYESTVERAHKKIWSEFQNGTAKNAALAGACATEEFRPQQMRGN